LASAAAACGRRESTHRNWKRESLGASHCRSLRDRCLFSVHRQRSRCEEWSTHGERQRPLNARCRRGWLGIAATDCAAPWEVHSVRAHVAAARWRSEPFFLCRRGRPHASPLLHDSQLYQHACCSMFVDETGPPRRAHAKTLPIGPESRRSSYGEWVYDPQAVERVISPWLNPNRNRRRQQRLQVAAICRARLLTGAARSARQHTHVNQRERGCRGGDGRSPLVRPV